MTVPNWLSGSFNFLETTGVTDVANTITRIVAQATALSGSAAWSNPLSGKIVSSADASGRSITVQFNKISATNLEMVLTDGSGRTFTRRAQFSGSMTERIYANQFGVFIDFSNGEGLWASILDPTPNTLLSHDQWATGHGARTSADALDGNFKAAGAMQLDASSPRVFVAQTMAAVVQCGSRPQTQNFVGYSYSGSRLWYPFIHHGPNTAGDNRVRGRVFQCMLVHASEGDQSEFSVTVDQSTSVLMKILGFPTNGTGSSKLNCKMAVRKA